MTETSGFLKIPFLAASLVLLMAEYEMLVPMPNTPAPSFEVQNETMRSPLEVDLAETLPGFMATAAFANWPALAPLTPLIDGALEIVDAVEPALVLKRAPASGGKRLPRVAKTKRQKASPRAVPVHETRQVLVPDALQIARDSAFPRDLASAAADAADETYREMVFRRQERRAKDVRDSARERVVIQDEE